MTEGPNGEPPGRRNFHGEPTITVDVRLTKLFRIAGAADFEVLFEAFNLLNRVNRGLNFTEAYESPNFGLWNQNLETNQLQMQVGVRLQF
ncbi:MAG: hypothetical protein ACRD3V_25635 [Vicinamibacteria bacterium]